ncbi:hypothetical protein BDZ89DRAFT_1087358 [Hymenopellis radicata]|nr:hypothetical protein BDZ89DRAFT_1087358 [Hymenopellis radicata]
MAHIHAREFSNFDSGMVTFVGQDTIDTWQREVLWHFDQFVSHRSQRPTKRRNVTVVTENFAQNTLAGPPPASRRGSAASAITK